MARLTPKDFVLTWAAEARMYKKVAVLVEDLQDIPFWRNMLKKFGAISADFPYKDAVGKNDIERFVPYLKERNAEGYILICRDSDNEYFYNESHYLSHEYVLQTHAYSIENIKSYPAHLSQICEDICHLSYDFEAFFIKYSQIVYPIFLYYLYFNQEKYPEKWQDLVSVDKLKTVISLAYPSRNEEYEWIESIDKEGDIKGLLNILIQKVADFIQEIENYLEEEYMLDYAKERLLKLEQEIKSFVPFPILSDVIFYYINGHLLWDNVTMPLFKKIISLKEQEYLQILSSEKKKQYQNLIKEKDILTLLDNSYTKHFENNLPECPLVKQIQADILRICKKYPQK